MQVHPVLDASTFCYICMSIYISDLYIDQRLGGGRMLRKQSKKAINLADISYNGKPQAGGCVNFFLSAIHRWTGF